MDEDHMDNKEVDEMFDDYEVEEIIDLDDDDVTNDNHHVDDDDDDNNDENGIMDDADMVTVLDDADVVFMKHEGSVFCVSTDANSVLAVSGGEDDSAYVWNASNGEVCFKCSGHKDSVVAASFSRTSKFVVSADMSGLVQVWATETGDLVWSAECSDIEWVSWHHLTDAVLAGTADGAVWMWKVPSGECKIYQGPGCACSCGKLTPDGKHLITGYGDGSLRVWDLKIVTVTFSITGSDVHKGAVTSVDAHADNNLVLTSSTDGTAKLISLHGKKVLRTFDCTVPKPSNAPLPSRPSAPSSGDDMNDDGEHEGDEAENESEDDRREEGLECARFSGTHPYIATASLCGRLTVWDTGTQAPRCTCVHEAGIVSCVWDANLPTVYTCTLDGLVHQWDARTGDKLKQWSGHRAQILHLDLTRDGTRLVSSSDDGTARVFVIDNVER